MPNPIDLDRSDYADRDPQTGKWRRPLSKRAARNWTLFSAAFLFALLSQSPDPVEFGLVTLIAFFAGVFAQQWLRDLY